MKFVKIINKMICKKYENHPLNIELLKERNLDNVKSLIEKGANIKCFNNQKMSMSIDLLDLDFIKYATQNNTYTLDEFKGFINYALYEPLSGQNFKTPPHEQKTDQLGKKKMIYDFLKSCIERLVIDKDVKSVELSKTSANTNIKPKIKI